MWPFSPFYAPQPEQQQLFDAPPTPQPLQKPSVNDSYEQLDRALMALEQKDYRAAEQIIEELRNQAYSA